MAGNTIDNYTIRISNLHISMDSRASLDLVKLEKGLSVAKYILQREVEPKGAFLQNGLRLDVPLFSLFTLLGHLLVQALFQF